MDRIDRFFIKEGYKVRDTPEPFIDLVPNITYQPDVYPFAGYLAHKFGCEYATDFGCGTASKLVKLSPLQNVLLDGILIWMVSKKVTVFSETPPNYGLGTRLRSTKIFWWNVFRE
jgi:hypothetical protein